MRVRFRLNGSEVEADVRADELGVTVLRRLGVGGCRAACGVGMCGACTALLDGEPVATCILPAPLLTGHDVTTVEGLGDDHPVVEGFVHCDAVQCGYCTPGFVLTAEALLSDDPAPSRARVREELAGNLCRCGCYPKIVEAVMTAAERGRGSGASSGNESIIEVSVQFDHSFNVPAPPEQAFAALRDIERVAPCMPGATVDHVDGDSFSGRVKIKLGPMQVTYRGSASFTELDPDAHRAVIEARGEEARGSGAAQATVTAQLARRTDGGTDVRVHTDLAVTGKPAQFGRGVLAEVGSNLLDEFASCLAQRLEADGARPTGAAIGTSGGVTEPSRDAGPQTASLDLVGVAAGPVLRRLAPAMAALVVLALVFRWLRRRSRRRAELTADTGPPASQQGREFA